MEDGDSREATWLIGDLVDVCIQTAETAGVGDDLNAFTKRVSHLEEGATQQARQVVVTFSCEHRERGRNDKGAFVLHATRIHGSEVVTDADSEDEPDDPETHRGDKAERHAIFAEWVVATFGADLLAQGCGTLEVAAGKGFLSRELRAQCGEALVCTLVEPCLRTTDTALQDDGLRWLAESFDTDQFPVNHPQLLGQCSVLLGLHPDQPTEDIVDSALRLGKPFAVVPCCVYPRLFPQRRTETGQGVVTYKGFVKYLRAKDVNIRCAWLPFPGRNRVLYHMGSEGAPAATRDSPHVCRDVGF